LADFLDEALEDGAEAAAVLLLLDFGGGVGLGDLDAALDEVGVDNLDREELGVSDLGPPPGAGNPEGSRYFGFCTCLLDLEPDELVETGTGSSSKSMRRCVLERRLALVRPVIIEI
jgi:hypothetical protein